MINVNNITSTLAKLPDQALQQYAMMHKNDPYVMSLAVSESNRRKEMRAAQGAQGGMQAQPKVVDAAVAEMAPQAQPMPEDSGIGQLPAGDMEFAGGGILAFAQGDSIPGPQSPFERRVEELKKSRVGQGLKSAGLMPNVDEEIKAQKLRQALVEKYGASSGIPGAFKAQSDEERKKATDILNNLDSMSVAEMEQALSGAAPASAPKQDPLRAQEAAAGIPDGSVVPPVMSGTPDLPVTPNESPYGGEGLPVVPEMPAAPVGIAQVAGPTVASAAPVSMDYAGARTGLAALPEFAPVTTELDKFKEEKEAAAQKGVDRSKERLTREEKFQDEMGEYGVGKEKRLKEREAKLSKDEKSNYGLAFLETGLAMMGGESPNPLVNISKSALQGLGKYKTGLAKLNDRKEKLFDAYDSLEDARRSDKKDKFARIEAAQDKISSAQTALENVSVDVLGKTVEMNDARRAALGNAVINTANTQYAAQTRAAEGAANRATQASIAGSQQANARAVAEAQMASQERVAAMPKGQERLFEALADPTSNVAKGMAAYAAAMGKDKDTATADFVRYVEAATKNADPTNPPNMDTLLQQFLAAQQRLGGAKMTSSLPQGAQTVK